MTRVRPKLLALVRDGWRTSGGCPNTCSRHHLLGKSRQKLLAETPEDGRFQRSLEQNAALHCGDQTRHRRRSFLLMFARPQPPTELPVPLTAVQQQQRRQRRQQPQPHRASGALLVLVLLPRLLSGERFIIAADNKTFILANR